MASEAGFHCAGECRRVKEVKTGMQTAVKIFKNLKEGKKEQNRREELLRGIFFITIICRLRITVEKAAENFQKIMDN